MRFPRYGLTIIVSQLTLSALCVPVAYFCRPLIFILEARMRPDVRPQQRSTAPSSRAAAVRVGQQMLSGMRAVAVAITVSIASLNTDVMAADAKRQKCFPLAQKACLQLAIPAGWDDKLESTSPPRISFSQRQGDPFIVVVSPITPDSGAATRFSREMLRERVERVLAGVLPFSVEQTIAVVEFKDTARTGFYFVATDKDPQPGGYKIMNQGALEVDELPLGFIILTNPGQESVVLEALDMLRHAAVIRQ